MGERKVVNTYIPADFDPSLVPRGKKLSAKDGTVPVRMMLPFSLQCGTCHTFLYRGRKFNSKKEAMGGPDGKYLGITRWRFYIKCTHCSRPITFLTDPQHADYEMESGGVRNYEIQKDKVATEEEAAADHEKEEKEDPMKALENRVLESQKEMADLDNLEEIKAMNARHVKLLSLKRKSDNAGVLGSESEKGDAEIELTEDDEALIRSIKFGTQAAQNSTEIKRLDEKDEWQIEQRRKQDLVALEDRQQQLKEAATKTNTAGATAHPTLTIVKRRKVVAPGANAPKVPTQSTETTTSLLHASPTRVPASAGGLADLLGGYSSSDDST